MHHWRDERHTNSRSVQTYHNNESRRRPLHDRLYRATRDNRHDSRQALQRTQR